MIGKDDPLAAVLRAAVAEEVAGTVRHDLRNKLASIRNAAFYLQRKASRTDLWKEDRRVPEFFKLIDDEVVEIERIVGQRLSFAQAYLREEVPLDLSTVAERVLQSIQLPSNIQLVPALGEVPAITGDPREIELLARCLLENAVEAMPDGGTLSVLITAPSHKVLLMIEDSGGGWSESDRERAMQAFVTDKPGHAGVGLNIARRIALRHGGAITLHQKSAGALVEVALPCAGGP